MKICKTCKENKELTDFSTNKSALDGLCPNCRSCVSAYNKAYRQRNAAKIKEQQAKYYEDHSDIIKNRSAEYREANREHVLEQSKERYAAKKDEQREYYQQRYENNPELLKRIAEKSRQWKLNNPDKVAAQTALRRARKLEATPKWADLQAIAEIYKRCSEISEQTEIAHQVDHIIPLNGDLVCGLHVESNLQIITAEENNKKNNSFNPDDFETKKNPA